MRSRWVLVKCDRQMDSGMGAGDGDLIGGGFGDGTSGWGHLSDGGDEHPPDNTPYWDYQPDAGYEFMIETEASE